MADLIAALAIMVIIILAFVTALIVQGRAHHPQHRKY